MGKFELFLLIVGVVALVVYGQMPPHDQSVAIDTPPVVYPSPNQSRGDSTLVDGVSGGAGGGEIYGFPILRQFSAVNFDIVDGDSIRLATPDGRVDLRLASIDAPEWTQTSGQAAKRKLQRLTAGRRATFFQTDTDRYDRPVVFMFVSGSQASDGATEGWVGNNQIDVNAQMVADGFAWHAIKYSSSERLAWFEQYAISRRSGLWAGDNPVPPWEFRARK